MAAPSARNMGLYDFTCSAAFLLPDSTIASGRAITIRGIAEGWQREFADAHDQILQTYVRFSNK
ncbi:hypothetical protein HJFPF1_06038 [Paramyrothecium foliicola]|nr:hypothetical protein HJFPF1_06038 [Paramyrothecium foliicola]